MKKTTLALILSVFTASTLFPAISYADGPGNGPNKEWRNGQGGHDNHDRGGDRGGPEHREQPRHENRDRPAPQVNRGHGPERDHFAWSGHDFRRGHPAPPRFRGDDYRVNDWRARGLYEPPHGSHWAYIDGNYVLIAAATGIITSIILNSALR